MATNNAVNNTPSNPATVAQGGTDLSSLTANTILCGGTTSTGALQQVSGVGTSGQVLGSSGSGIPSWVTGPAWQLISTQTASSSSSITFTSGITSTYNNYVLICTNIINATGSENLILQISTNGGSSYLSSGYDSGINTTPYNSATVTNTSITSGFLLFPSVPTSSPGSSGIFFLNGLTAGVYPMVSGLVVQSSSVIFGNMGGMYTSGTETVNALSIASASGNITSGTFSLYSVTN